MTETQTLALAASLEVNLDVDTETTEPVQILATPSERITPELREGIRENRDALLRTLLFKKAAQWLRDKPFEAPPEADERLNEAWHTADLGAFRDALRAWARAGLEAGKEGAA